MSDQSVPRPRANPRPDVEFTPVTNGLDYLISGEVVSDPLSLPEHSTTCYSHGRTR